MSISIEGLRSRNSCKAILRSGVGDIIHAVESFVLRLPLEATLTASAATTTSFVSPQSIRTELSVRASFATLSLPTDDVRGKKTSHHVGLQTARHRLCTSALNLASFSFLVTFGAQIS